MRGSAVVAALFINIKMKNYGREKCNIFRAPNTHKKKKEKKREKELGDEGRRVKTSIGPKKKPW